MKRKTLLAAMTLTASVFGGAAFAESHHGHSGQPGAKPAPGMMQSDAHGMMGSMKGMMDMKQPMHGDMMDGMKGMMHRMHSNMMDSGIMGGMGPMGGGMMQMFDADGDGTVTPDEMRAQLQAKLTEFDIDGDGTLSIAEFETLHSAMIREMMVDRFQHLDADGDGAVTAEEMVAPAEKMDRMQMMRSHMAQPPVQSGESQGMGDGTMMNDN